MTPEQAEKERQRSISLDKALLTSFMQRIKRPDFELSKLKTDAGREVFDRYAMYFDGLTQDLKTDIENLS